MASRKEQKERLRQQRLEEERRAQADERRKQVVGLGIAGLLAVAVAAGIVVVILAGGDGGGGGCANAHIVDAPFTTHEGVKCDDRKGVAPAPVKNADLASAAKAAKCDLRLGLREEGRTHLPADAPVPKYKTKPPTSGNHDAIPTSDGAYLTTPNPKHFVHSLEHGRIEIQYSPKLPRKDQLALKGVFDEDPYHLLMFPNPDMPYEVAAPAWTNLLGCKQYTPAALDAIRDFRDTFRDQGPEQVQ